MQVIPKVSTQPDTTPRRKPILKKGSQSFPSAKRAYRFDSIVDRSFPSSYSVDESEESELSEKVSDLLVTDLDDSSTSISSYATVVEVHPQKSDEKSLSSPQRLGNDTAEKFFQVVKKEITFSIEICCTINSLLIGVRHLGSNGNNGFRHLEENIENSTHTRRFANEESGEQIACQVSHTVYLFNLQADSKDVTGSLRTNAQRCSEETLDIRKLRGPSDSAPERVRTIKAARGNP